MTEGHRKGRSGTKKYGRNKDKCARYRLLGIREKNKLKRVLKNNGYKQAKIYAEQYGLNIPGA